MSRDSVGVTSTYHCPCKHTHTHTQTSNAYQPINIQTVTVYVVENPCDAATSAADVIRTRLTNDVF